MFFIWAGIQCLMTSACRSWNFVMLRTTQQKWQMLWNIAWHCKWVEVVTLAKTGFYCLIMWDWTSHDRLLLQSPPCIFTVAITFDLPNLDFCKIHRKKTTCKKIPTFWPHFHRALRLPVKWIALIISVLWTSSLWLKSCISCSAGL